MARSVNVKVFYAALALVAVGGVAAIWSTRGAGGEAATPVSAAEMAAVGAYEGYVMGSDSAPVEVVEFADFQCPACARFAVLTGPDVQRRLVAAGLVRWRFHDFPLPQHQNAMAAHLAAACAGDQGAFWPMHDQLFFRQGEWATERRPERRFREYAQGLGLDGERFEECLESRRHAARIEVAKREATELGVRSTPTFIVGGLRVPGVLSYDSLRSLVERAAGGDATP